jgi:hypothetical protein
MTGFMVYCGCPPFKHVSGCFIRLSSGQCRFFELQSHRGKKYSSFVTGVGGQQWPTPGLSPGHMKLLRVDILPCLKAEPKGREVCQSLVLVQSIRAVHPDVLHWQSAPGVKVNLATRRAMPCPADFSAPGHGFRNIRGKRPVFPKRWKLLPPGLSCFPTTHPRSMQRDFPVSSSGPGFHCRIFPFYGGRIPWYHWTVPDILS